MRKLLITGLLSLHICTRLLAVPALHRAYTVRQSDGTTLVVYKQGDEASHCYVTQDGVLVARDSGGSFFYASRNAEGTPVASDFLAHEAPARSRAEIAQIGRLKSITFNNASTTRPHLMPRANVGSQATAQVHAIGSPNIPVILIQYSDVSFSMSDPKTFYDKHCNGVNYTDEGGAGSVRDYFVAMSDSLFQPHFDIIGPVTLDKTMAYYGANTGGDGSDIRINQMITDAIAKASNAGTDFSKYDEDKDGKVNIVYTIYAGYGENSYDDPNCVWPKQGSLSYSVDGIRVTAYACNNELVDYVKRDASGNPVPTVDGIGVFCHEFSHCLGLPDFYNTDSQTDIFGLSYWSLMDYGEYWNNSYTPIGYSAYEREFMGWLKSDVISSAQDISLPPLGFQQKAYCIVNDANSSEYFILENRQPSKWFPKSLGTGMVAFHVDYVASVWNSNEVNNTKYHQHMTLISADGELKKENQKDVVVNGDTIVRRVTAYDFRGDVYPSYTIKAKYDANGKLVLDTIGYVNSLVSPADSVYTGGFMGKPITNIAFDADGNVKGAFMGGDPSGIVQLKAETSAAQNKTVEVYNLLGRLVRKQKGTNGITEGLPAGLYVIKCFGHTKKMMIN
jgi:immune inhibitor A